MQNEVNTFIFDRAISFSLNGCSVASAKMDICCFDLEACLVEIWIKITHSADTRLPDVNSLNDIYHKTWRRKALCNGILFCTIPLCQKKEKNELYLPFFIASPLFQIFMMKLWFKVALLSSLLPLLFLLRLEYVKFS